MCCLGGGDAALHVAWAPLVTAVLCCAVLCCADQAELCAKGMAGWEEEQRAQAQAELQRMQEQARAVGQQQVRNCYCNNVPCCW